VSEAEYHNPPERRSFVDSISAVAGNRRPLGGKQVVGLIVGAIVVYFAVQGVRHVIHVPPPEPKPKVDAGSEGGGRPFTAPPMPPVPGVQNAAFQQPGAPPMPANNQFGPIYERLNGTGTGKHEKTPEELARESDISMGGNGTAQVSGSPGGRPGDPDAPPGAQSDLGRSLQPTEVSASVAHAIPHPDFTVSEGAVIPCTNLTPLSSGQAVFVTAEIPADVWGMTHKVRLIDAGATITGEIRMANAVTPGQNRIPVLWRNITTKGDHPIRISVNSPAGDELGLGGLQGTVISHWLRRIGGALLYTGIQSGTQLGTAALLGGRGGGSNIYSFGNGISNDVAAEALRENANIPDEIKRDQGLSCSILLGRDLDFSKVYGLRPVSGGTPLPLNVRATRQ
jgi:type IV secretion system protein VirB10